MVQTELRARRVTVGSASAARRNRKIRSALSTAGIGLFVAAVVLFTLFPFYWMLKSSFQTNLEIMQIPTAWVPSSIAFDAYARALVRVPFLRYMGNSLLVSLVTAIGATLIASMAAYVLARHKFPGATLILGIILFTQLIPGVTRIFPIYFLIKNLNLLNSYTGLTISYMGFSIPYAVLMLQGYFRSSCPPELEEAALIDGASWFGAFAKVVLPVSIPGIVAITIYTFLGAWNDFLWASLLLNQGMMKTIQVGLRDFMSETGSVQNLNSFMAACVMTTIPSILLFLFLQRGIVSGISAGSVKG